MSCNRWLTALLALSVGSEAGAQDFFWGRPRGFPEGRLVIGRKPKLVIGWGGYVPGGYFVEAGPFDRGPWGPWDPWRPRGYPGFRQVTVVIVQQPPAIIIEIPADSPALNDPDLELVPSPRRRRPDGLPDRPMPRERQAPLPEKKPEKKPEERPIRPLPQPKQPLENKQDEYDRLLKLGKDAFKAQEYGRARERFAQAVRLLPNQPQAHFHLIQAQVALGKYHDAVEELHAGLALKPDWPNERFRPLELYGDNVVDHAEHLARLEATLAQHPADPVLLFLSAYQLWFDGRRDEARPLLQRALRRGADRADVERFLRALPAEDL